MHEYSSLDVPMNMQGGGAIVKTIIEDDVWIGTNVIIMPGIKVSSGCIIGAGCVLTKDTEPNGIYVGVPGKLLKHRI